MMRMTTTKAAQRESTTRKNDSGDTSVKGTYVQVGLPQAYHYEPTHFHHHYNNQERALGYEAEEFKNYASSGHGPLPLRPALGVDTSLMVLRVTRAFYDNYLKEYVEGRVGTKPTVTEQESEPLTEWMQSWLEGSAAGSRPPVCLIGDGGTGKTSAAVALQGFVVLFVVLWCMVRFLLEESDLCVFACEALAMSHSLLSNKSPKSALV